MRFLLLIVLLLSLVLGGLQVINNGLDTKYLIEPFDAGGDVLELRRIAIEKINSNTSTVVLLLVLNVIGSISAMFFSVKANRGTVLPLDSLTEE